MSPQDATVCWRKDAERFKAEGNLLGAQWATYYASLAAGEANPEQHAPEAHRVGLRDLNARRGY